MADIYTKEKRSEIMSKIKSKNTGPELKMADALTKKQINFQMHGQLIGKPDFVLPDIGIILFVDGEFWHGHTLTPEKREKLTEFWTKKLDRNMERDREVTSALKKMGWCVIRVTDRQVNKQPDKIVSKIMRSHGQLIGKNRKKDPEIRIAELGHTLLKSNTVGNKISVRQITT